MMFRRARSCIAILAVTGSLATASERLDKSDFWSFKSAAKPQLPQVREPAWARNPIDLFILAKLDQKRLRHTVEADRRTLIRRLSFDVTGLPPEPREVEEFVRDTRPNAYERLVDRLLGSPRYGERWGRHWLDVVHFGETHGYDKDKLRPHAWPYRDYVIRAFNGDKPYRRFIEEQLGGDVLFPDSADGIVATGFVAAGPWDYVGHVELPESKTDGLIARYNDRDDMVMTSMSTFQSLTVHCARCHDHKFDPITQRDYYSLQAVFAGVDRANRSVDRDPATHQKRQRLLAERKVCESEKVESERELSKVLVEPSPEILSKLSGTLFRLEQLKKQLAGLPQAQTVYAAAHDFAVEGSFKPAQPIRTVHLLARGDVKRPKETMAPGALTVFSNLKPAFALTNASDEGSRRVALAQWLTHTNNLLTRRSIVNRVWQYHFGRGIVETANDFGHMGAQPSHPELLDWLAFWFMENGESLKDLHRLILTSATYRQSSAGNAEHAKIDSDNRLLWRMNRTRLEAEAVRDAMLTVSGELDLAMGGPSIRQFYFKDDHSPIYDYTRFDVDNPGAKRRAVYRHIVRSVPDPFMDCLDAADPSLLTSRRNTTLTALQALATLNNPFVIRQAERFAERLRRSGENLSAQIGIAYTLAFSRSPAHNELNDLKAHVQKHGLPSACRLLFNCNEFIFVD